MKARALATIEDPRRLWSLQELAAEPGGRSWISTTGRDAWQPAERLLQAVEDRIGVFVKSLAVAESDDQVDVTLERIVLEVSKTGQSLLPDVLIVIVEQSTQLSLAPFATLRLGNVRGRYLCDSQPVPRGSTKGLLDEIGRRIRMLQCRNACQSGTGFTDICLA